MQPLPTPTRPPGPNGPNGAGCPSGSLAAVRPRRSTGAPHPDACSRTERRHELMSAGSTHTPPSGALVVAAILPPGTGVDTTAGGRGGTA